MRLFFALLALLALASCVTRQSNPRVVHAASLRAAAQACMDRDYAYIVRTGRRSFYCLLTNPLDEPEALRVSDVLR